MSENLFGALPEGWSLASLGEVCAEGLGGIQTGPFGSQLHAHDYVADGVPTVMPTNIGDNRIIEDGIARISPSDVERLSKHKLAVGDIVYSRRGDVEKRALVRDGEKGWLCGTGCLRVRIDPAFAEPPYVSYVLGHPRVRAWISQHAVGATMPNLNSGILAEVPVIVPPRPDQRFIADLLGALDDKIESGLRLRRLLEATIGAEFTRATVGRARVSYSEALAVDMGSPFSGSEFSTPGIGRPLIRIRDLRTHQSDTWTTEVRDDEHVVVPGDILVGMDAEFRSHLWQGAPSVLNQRVCRFRPKEGVSRAFTLLAIRHDLALNEQAKSGTTVIHLNKSDIARFAVPELTSEEHVAFSLTTEPLVDLWVRAAGESRTLVALREALLPELLSGRLRVPEAEELVSEVV